MALRKKAVAIGSTLEGSEEGKIASWGCYEGVCMDVFEGNLMIHYWMLISNNRGLKFHKKIDK